LSKTIGVKCKTALAFQHKIRLAMQRSEPHPMKGQVEVGEGFIGGQEGRDHRGREAGSKTQIVVAVEKARGKGVQCVYAREIGTGSTSELRTVFDNRISKSAKVLTDKWRNYGPVAKEYTAEQERSDPKINFLTMYRCLQPLKSWIGCNHPHVSPQYLQAYLNEFCYRINRSIH
jgi:hypothetical protein